MPESSGGAHGRGEARLEQAPGPRRPRPRPCGRFAARAAPTTLASESPGRAKRRRPRCEPGAPGREPPSQRRPRCGREVRAVSAIPPSTWAPLDARVACGRNPLTEDDAPSSPRPASPTSSTCASPGSGRATGRSVPRRSRRSRATGSSAARCRSRTAPRRARRFRRRARLPRRRARPAGRAPLRPLPRRHRAHGAILAAWYAWREDLDPLDGLVELVARVPRLAPLPSRRARGHAALAARGEEERPPPLPAPPPRSRASRLLPRRQRPAGRAPDTGAPARHVVLPVPWRVRLFPWELRRVKLGLLPREMEEKWLLVWEAPELRGDPELDRLRDLPPAHEGVARRHRPLDRPPRQPRDRAVQQTPDPDEDLATASRLLSFLTGRPHGPEQTEEARRRTTT